MSEAAALIRPLFPPLLTGVPCPGRADPLAVACALAADPETEPGTVVYAEDDRRLGAALILAPDRPLREAAAVTLAVQAGLADAIGAVAPPEVACHLEWPDRIRINGAIAGGFRMVASDTDPRGEPDWMVIAADLALAPRPGEGGNDTAHTTLHEEGCGEVTAPALIEAFAHHMMARLHAFMTEGLRPIHADYAARAWKRGEDIEYPEAGRLTGFDEEGGLILRTEAATRILPLHSFILADKLHGGPGV